VLQTVSGGNEVLFEMRTSRQRAHILLRPAVSTSCLCHPQEETCNERGRVAKCSRIVALLQFRHAFSLDPFSRLASCIMPTLHTQYRIEFSNATSSFVQPFPPSCATRNGSRQDVLFEKYSEECDIAGPPVIAPALRRNDRCSVRRTNRSLTVHHGRFR